MRSHFVSPVACLTAVVLLSSHPLRAQCRQWDSTLGFPAGVDGFVGLLQSCDDGHTTSLFVAGSFTTAGQVPVQNLAGWDGRAWSELFGGTATGLGDWTPYSLGGSPSWVGSGYFSEIGGVAANNIALWDGSTWQPLGSGLDSTVFKSIVFDDGSGPALYSCGGFAHADGLSANLVAKWDGSIWSPLGSGLGGLNGAFATSMVGFDDGSGPALYVGGQFTTAGGAPATYIAKWDGSSWSDVGGGMSSDVYTLTVFDDGGGPALYAGGYFTIAGGVTARHVARWDGTTWSAVGAGLGHPNPGGEHVNVLYPYDDGTGAVLYAAGQFHYSGGSIVHNIARWDGTTWTQVGPSFNGPVGTLAAFNDGSRTSLYAGGSFSACGTHLIHHVARWDGNDWYKLDSGLMKGTDAAVYALSTFDLGGGPKLYAGGNFTMAGGVVASHVAERDGSTWRPLGSGTDDDVYALGHYSDGSGEKLFAGGVFQQAGGNPAHSIAAWDGSSWSDVGGGFAGSNVEINAFAVFDDGSGPQLITGGGFSHAGGVPADNIARWNGTSWSPMGSGADNTVDALTAFDDGSGPALYMGGNFFYAGGNPCHGIARWNGASWLPLGTGLDFGTVDALAVFDDGSGPALFIGGQFSSVGGIQANGIAKWNGSVWSAVGSGIFEGVAELAVFDDGNGPALYAGGPFTHVGTLTATGIAKWNGTAWSALDRGIAGEVYALSSYDDGSNGGPALYAGGWFQQAGRTVSTYLAEWRNCGGTSVSFCSGDGTVARCPCGNTGGVGRGCENARVPEGALLTNTGSIDADTVVFHVVGEMPTALTVFVQGDAQLPPTSYGVGLRCLGGHFRRLYIKNAVNGAASAPGSGELGVRAQSAHLGDPIPLGSNRYYQTLYRDTAPSTCLDLQGGLFNLSSGIRITW